MVKYSELEKVKIFDKICDRIAEGESLRSILKTKGMPSSRSLYKWLADENNKELVKRYALAREIQAENLAQEIIDIADNATNDWMKSNDPDNEGYIINGEAINRSRLRIDSRKWVASKLLPSKYGDKGNNISITTNTQNNYNEGMDELSDKLQAIIDLGKPKKEIE